MGYLGLPKKWSAVISCLVVASALVTPRFVFAGGVVSNNTDADLRAALVGGGTVTFAIDGTIVLTNTLVITNNTVLDGSGHSVTLSGGGAVRVLLVNSGANLTLRRLTIANGHAVSGLLNGGGLLNNGGAIVVECTFSDNFVTGTSWGGAIFHSGTSLQITGSTFVQNNAGVSGGAISTGYLLGDLWNGNIVVTNCTFFANGGGVGGAVSIGEPLLNPVTLVNCTFAWNTNGSVRRSVSGFYPGAAGVRLINCVVADTVGASGVQGIEDLGHNLSTDGSFTNATSLVNANPMLGPLADNGGPTLTMALLPDSPAINAADPAFAPSTDQRGFARPYGAGYDIGALETVFIGTNAGMVRFTSANYDVLQSTGIATITVYRDNGATGAVSVHFETSDGTAIAGQDYTATNATLAFNPGEISKSFTVPIETNPPASSAKTVNLTLSNPTGGATLGAPSQAVLNILPTTRLITSNDETGLRSAVSSGGVLLLAFDGTITLTNPLVVGTSVSLDASGYEVAISGSNLTRLFNVQPGVTLSLNNLTLADGLARGTNGAPGTDGGAGQGGAIYSDGAIINALNCSFLRNGAEGGTGGAANISASNGNGGPASGGSLYLNGGWASLTNCLFTMNRSIGGTGGVGDSGHINSTGGNALGGAICNRGGAVQLVNCVLASNTASGGQGLRVSSVGVGGGLAYGGAVCTITGEVWLVRCVLSDNTDVSGGTRSTYGGAVYQDSGNTYIVESLLESNTAVGGRGVPAFAGEASAGHAFGGAICTRSGFIWITNSTLSANLALGGPGIFPGSGFGGGVFSTGALQVVNSTIFGNTARSGTPTFVGAPQGSGWGGGLYNNGGSMSLDYVTIAGNGAAQTTGGAAGTGTTLGGGILSTNGTASLRCTIVANSYSGSNCFGTLSDLGHNLSSDASCGFSAPGSLNNTDPIVGPLDDYGGPTPTVPLLAGSPAIDAGDNANSPPTDQRGRARPFGSSPDIGAFESSPPYTITGDISGNTLIHEVEVAAGPYSSVTANHGHYSLQGLPAGGYAVTPANSNYVFFPDNRPVTVGPDQINVNFRAYRWNTLSFEGVSDNSIHIIYPGTNGHTVEVLASSNLTSWSSISTNVVGSSNLLQILIPISTGTPKHFYRTVEN